MGHLLIICLLYKHVIWIYIYIVWIKLVAFNRIAMQNDLSFISDEFSPTLHFIFAWFVIICICPVAHGCIVVFLWLYSFYAILNGHGDEKILQSEYSNTSPYVVLDSAIRGEARCSELWSDGSCPRLALEARFGKRFLNAASTRTGNARSY